MTPTCGNCKFWDVGTSGIEPNYGVCENEVVEFSYADSRACGVFSDGDYPLLFGRYFGCIHFSAKAEQPAVTLWTKRPYA